MKWAGIIARTGIRNAHKILVRKSQGKRPLGRLRHRMDDNVKMDIREMVCEQHEIGLGQG